MDATVFAALRDLLREREDMVTAYLFGCAAEDRADAVVRSSTATS